MEILKTCLDEISLSGLEGCTIEELWKFLNERQPPISFKLDDYIKRLAWKQILKFAEDSDAVQLYKLPTPRELQQTLFQITVGSSLQWIEYNHPFPYRPINDATTGARGSCANYSERQNVTSEVISQQMDLAGVSECYGNSLVLVTSQELRERALVPLTQSPHSDISDVQYGLLEVVGCSRHYGSCRPSITTKYLKIDARSVYHHSKTLRKLGLIVVKTQRRNTSDNANRSQVTHVIYLTRFAPPTDLVPEMVSFEANICTLLERAPHQALPLKTLQEKLGAKKVKAAKSILVRKGFVKSVVMGDVAEEFASDPELAKAKGCVLIKPYQEWEGGEGGEDDEDEGEEEVDLVPIVAELPLLTQGYRLVDSYGPQGITNQDFCHRKGLSLDPYVNRTISKSLIKQSKVFAITLDSTQIRTLMLVSNRHLQSNSEYLRLQEEKAKSGDQTVELAIITGERYGKEKPRIKKETAVTEGAGPSGVQEGGVPLINLHGYGLPLEGDEEIKQVLENRLSKSDEMELGSVASEADTTPPLSLIGTPIPESESTPDSKVMTYHQLRRCNIIMEYMKQQRIIQGHVDLARYLRDVEKGRVVTIDNKTVSKLLQRLEQDQRLFHRDEVLEAHLGEESVVSYQTATFWCVIDTTEEEIKAAKEKAVQNFYCIVQRRNIRRRGKRKSKKDESSSEDESESEGDEDDDSERDFVSKVTPAPKFQRLRHLHYYLWILAYGRDPIEEGEPVEEKTEGADGEMDTIKRGKEKKTDSILPETNFPWAKAVDKLPQSSKGEGWVQFSEIHHRIPLSLWLILIKMYKGVAVGKLPGRYRKYFEDMEHKNKLLHQLPRKLRKSIIHAGRDMTHICDFLKQLAEMDIVTLDGWDVKRKTTINVYLNRSLTILDTSTAKPRSSFFTNEARHLFPPTTFVFDSLADVERYWFQLQTICLQTPIILREHPQKRDSDLALKDSYPLLYSAKMHLSRNKDAEYFEKGFGAAGLPPLTFSHLRRNWKSILQHGKMVQGSSASWASLGVGGASYLPGEGLHHLPCISMETNDDDDEVEGQSQSVSGEFDEDEVRGLPPSKRAKLIAGVSAVPGSQVKKNEGGRGRERFRHKKATPRKSKPAEVSSTSRYRFAQTTAMFIVDAPDADAHDREMAAATTYIPERAYFFPEEDSFLLLTYLTSAVMKELGQPLVTYSMIRDAFQSEFPTSKYKTLGAVKRRLNTLVRKKVEVAGNLQIFVTETIHLMNTMAGECPEPSFESILEFVRKKYHSEDGSFTLPHAMLLPPSLQQLHDDYEVIGEPQPKQSGFVPAESDQEIKRALLSNLILATVGSEDSSFDQYKAFKLFESFPEEDVDAVINELKHRYLIKFKRSTIGIPRRQGPNSTVSYTLSANFFSRLETHFLMSHSRDMEDFKETFDAQLTQSGSDDVISDTAISLVDSGLVRVDGETARNGTTAAVVDTLVANRNLIDCSTEFPDPLFEPGNEEGLEGAESDLSDLEGEEGDGREREDSSQAARQLVKTAMKEAERGTHSDEEDAMEFAGGEGGSEDGRTTSSSQAVVGTAGKCGSGINSLFNLGAGVLRYGPIDLTPGFSVGRLLDPVEELEAMTSEKSSLESHPVLTSSSTAEQSNSQLSTETESTGKALSLEGYLVLVGKALGFSDSDVEFAIMLYNVISSTGTFGITRESLTTHTSLSGLAHQQSIDEHIQTLINFEMVHCVGINEERLVSHSNSNFWSMTPDDITKGDTPFISYQPWSSVGNSNPNVAMVTSYCHGVFNYIMANPGVPMNTILEHFTGVLQPTGLQRVLNLLEMSGCIKKHAIVDCSKNCHLFDTPPKRISHTYYEPIL